MPRFIKKTSKKAGMAPGSLVHIGDKKTEAVKISLINYDVEHLEQKQLLGSWEAGLIQSFWGFLPSSIQASQLPSLLVLSL